METSIERLEATISRTACAYSQISGNFHRAYYGFWDNYEHDHNRCCIDENHAHASIGAVSGAPRSR